MFEKIGGLIKFIIYKLLKFSIISFVLSFIVAVGFLTFSSIMIEVEKNKVYEEPKVSEFEINSHTKPFFFTDNSKKTSNTEKGHYVVFHIQGETDSEIQVDFTSNNTEHLNLSSGFVQKGWANEPSRAHFVFKGELISVHHFDFFKKDTIKVKITPINCKRGNLKIYSSFQ
jgi:hypothetical protein